MTAITEPGVYDLITQTDKVIADLRAAVATSRRTRRACPECGSNKHRAIHHADQRAAAERDMQGGRR